MKDHLLQLYEDDRFLVDSMLRYLEEGKALGEPLVVVATPDHRAALEPRAPPGTRFLDARETLDRLLVDGMPDAERFDAVVGSLVREAGDGGRRRVRAFGEMVALLWEEGNQEGALRLEALWSALGRSQPLVLLCAYPVRAFAGLQEPGPLARVRAAHGGDWDACPKALPSPPRGDPRIDQFLGTLAHELRSPLVPILLAAELLRRNSADPAKVAQWAATIARQGGHLRRLVDDLLDVSRVNAGRIELQRRAVPLGMVVELALEQVRPFVEERRHRFTVELPPDPPVLWGDSARLAQMLGNLLHNAAKYTPEGGRMGLRATARDGQLHLEVWDEGVGIPPGMAADIFGLFVQAAPPPGQSPGGLGLGLALARRIAQLHGGAIHAESPGIGAGSAFHVHLPLPAPAGPTPAAPEAAEEAQAGRRRILVVDDSPDVAESLKAYLEGEGHEVEAACDGPAALAQAAKAPPQVAFLDIGMPGMDGLELARRMHAAHPEVLLVALSGYAQGSDRRRSAEAGFAHHLAKPPDLAQMRAILQAPLASTPPLVVPQA